MTAATLTLADFVLARIAEDEAVARAASGTCWSYGDVESVAGGMLYDETRRIADLTYEQADDHDGTIVRHLLSAEADANGTHIARHDPARVLAECAAKRAIVDEHSSREVASLDSDTWGQPFSVCRRCRDGAGRQIVAPCPTLRALASVYADHPDLDPSWQ